MFHNLFFSFIYNSFFESHLRYTCQISAHKNGFSRIFRLQKQCLRLITFSKFNASSSPLFLNLRVLKLPHFVKLLNVCLICSVLSKTAPTVLINVYNLKMYTDSHNTRGNSLGLIARPICRTFQYGINSIVYQSLVQWNELQLLYPGLDLSNFSTNKLTKLYKSITFSGY